MQHWNTTLYPQDYCCTWTIPTKNSRYKANSVNLRTEQKTKYSRLFTELFQWTKWCAGKIHVLYIVVKIKPVNWLKRNQHMTGYKITANNCFKFGTRHTLYITQKWNKSNLKQCCWNPEIYTTMFLYTGLFLKAGSINLEIYTALLLLQDYVWKLAL